MLGTARVITKVVRNHTKLHAHYVENGGTAIDKWSDTRQVAAMYMVLSLKRNMPKLVALVLSDVFKKWGQSKHKRKTTDYDPMQGTAGQGKTNEQLAGKPGRWPTLLALWASRDGAAATVPLAGRGH